MYSSCARNLSSHCSQEHDRILLYTGLTLLTLFRFSHIFHTTLHWNQWQRDAARKAFRYLQMLGVFCMMLAKVLMKLHTKNAEHLPGWRRLTLILATIHNIPCHWTQYDDQTAYITICGTAYWHIILSVYIYVIYWSSSTFIDAIIMSQVTYSSQTYFIYYHINISYTIRLPLL